MKVNDIAITDWSLACGFAELLSFFFFFFQCAILWCKNSLAVEQQNIQNYL